jgi:hypothetical protein
LPPRDPNDDRSIFLKCALAMVATVALFAGDRIRMYPATRSATAGA